ncbi:hypothetical protein EVJ58_g10224, partial [Rhodofomes roseus]
MCPLYIQRINRNVINSDVLDPYGTNDEVDRAVRNLLIDEEIRQSLKADPQLDALHEKWLKECEDIMRPPPPGLPPYRE